MKRRTAHSLAMEAAGRIIGRRRNPDPPAPIPMILFCPNCGTQHVDAATPATGWTNPPHRSHLCEACDHVWRPADVCTVGVAEIATRGMADDEPPIRGDIPIDWTRK